VADQLQHTDPASQSEHIVFTGRRGFIDTGTKQSVDDRLEREWEKYEKYDHENIKSYSSRP